MKLLCVGDLHLGAGSDYGREPGERLREQADVWRRICRLAIEQRVNGVLFAGDAFERRRPSPQEIVYFRDGLEMLSDEGIGIVACVGNHDVEAFDRANALDTARVSGYFDPFAQPGTSYAFDGVGVACLPWTPVANLVARNGGGDRDELHTRAADLLLDAARDLRADMWGDRAKILLLHWSVSGASLPTSLPTDDLREPVLPLGELEQLGFDAIVCGHIHKAQMLRDRETGPRPIFYVGSPMPLNFGEAAVDHGVWILDTDASFAEPEFVPVESRPFVTLDYDVRVQDLVDLTFDGLGIDGAIVKLRYTATADQARRLDHAAIRQSLLEAGAHKVYAIEPTIEREARARVAGVDESIDERKALDMWVEANFAELPNHREIQTVHWRYLEEVAA